MLLAPCAQLLSNFFQKIWTVRTLHKPTIRLNIPKNYIPEEIEVIAFANNEEMLKEIPARKKVSFAVFPVDTHDCRFNRDEANKK